MTNTIKNPSKSQPKSKTQTLRENVEKSGFLMTDIAKTAKISPERFRRIIKRGSEPTLEEAFAIEEALRTLAKKVIDRLLNNGISISR